MLISVHLPKTAGKSFGASLEDHFGDRLQLDYDDFPINHSRRERNATALWYAVRSWVKRPVSAACIHGHFMPLKYRSYKNATFVTWLRDPIERLASHYHYWFRDYDAESSPALHKRVVEEEWSLERFCLAPQLRNFYCQYLWRFPLKRFHFVGITEHYDSEVEYFAKHILGADLQVYSQNQNPEKGNASYFEDKTLRQRVERYHRKDVELYDRAVAMRKATR